VRVPKFLLRSLHRHRLSDAAFDEQIGLSQRIQSSPYKSFLLIYYMLQIRHNMNDRCLSSIIIYSVNIHVTNGQ
jgi:hypothetical protein